MKKPKIRSTRPARYTNAQGIDAIIDLQAAVGKAESVEKATAGWTKMTDAERLNTENAHRAVFPPNPPPGTSS